MGLGLALDRLSDVSHSAVTGSGSGPSVSDVSHSAVTESGSGPGLSV